MKKRILSVLFIVALLVTALMVTAQAETPTTCPCGCGQALDAITWTSWNGQDDLTASGHYKLTAKSTKTKETLTDINVVLDLNGYQLINSNDGERTFKLDGAKLYVMSIANTGGKGGEIVSSSKWGGGAVYLDGSSELHLYSGTVRGYSSSTVDATSVTSGVIHAKSGNVYIHGGTVTGQKYSNLAVNYGGAIYMESGNLTMTGGTVNGGNANSGAAIYLKSGEATLTGGTIYGGTIGATGGGNSLYIANTCKTTLGGTLNVPDGEKFNIFLGGSADVTIEGAPCLNGFYVPRSDNTSPKLNTETAKIFVSKPTKTNPLTFTGTADAAACVASGSIQAADPALTLSYSEGLVFNTYDCPCCETEPAEIVWTAWVGSGGQPVAGTHYYLVEDGSWTTQASSVEGEYTLNLNGHTMNGSATRFAAFTADMTLNIVDSGAVGAIVSSYGQNGGIFNVTAGTLKLYDGTFKQTNPDYSKVGAVAQCATNGTICVLGDAVVDASAVTGANDNYAALVSKTNMTISGGTVIGGANAPAVYVHDTDKATLNIAGGTISGGANAPAVSVAKEGTVEFAEDLDMTAFNGKILSKGKLKGIGGALLMYQQSANGGIWYQTAQEAADLFVDADHDFIRLMGAATVKATQPGTFININGHDLTVDPASTETVKLANMMSSVTAADPATVTADEADIQLVTPYTKKVQYVALANGEGAYTVHRLELQLSYVTFRPAAFGFYYKATFNTDDVLASKITAYGVALSISGVPDASVYTRTEMTDFAAARGTDVKFGGLYGIMKESNTVAQNIQNGMQKVYANCYVKIGDTVILSDNSNVGKTASDEGFSGTGISLFDVMQKLNGMTLEGDALTAVNDFKAELNDLGIAWPDANAEQLEEIPLA